MKHATMLRYMAAILAVLLVAATADFSFGLGWFGGESRVVLSIALLLTCIVLAIAFRNES